MKTQIKSILACIALLLMITSCDKDEIENTLTLTVSPETVLRTTVPGQEESEYMEIIDDSEQTLYLPIGSIENFEYEKGFEYKVLVKKRNLENPPQDSVDAVYTLIEILSKEKKDTLPSDPEEFSLQWDSFIDNSAENTDIFIGTKYIGIQGWPLLANPPYIYAGATFPKNAFASSFDGEVRGNKNPVDLTFNFPVPYTTGMEEVKGTEYLQKLKEAMNSEEYKSYTPPIRPYIAKLAKLNSLANLDSCFSENKDFGNAFERIAKQEFELENVKSLSVGEIVFKGFTVSMEAPSNGLFIDNPSNLSELVYIRTLTYGVTAYFIIASRHSYQDVLTAFKGDDYQNPEGILCKSQIILLTVSDVSQEATIKSSFNDLKEFMNKPFYNKDAYGYPIFCKGFYAKGNQVFNGDNGISND